MRLAKSIKMMKEVVDKDLAKSMRDDVSTFDVSPATTEELAKISERYVHLMSVLAAMREQSEKLAELAVPFRNCQHVKDMLLIYRIRVPNIQKTGPPPGGGRGGQLSDLILKDMYDRTRSIWAIQPVTSVGHCRGVMEDRM